MSFSPEEIEEFKHEIIDLLDQAEDGLIGIESGEELKVNYQSIFRALHNIKGAAGMMDYTELQDHVHVVESAFTEYSDKETIESDRITYFLDGVDKARKIMGIDHGGSAEEEHISPAPESVAPSEPVATPPPATIQEPATQEQTKQPTYAALKGEDDMDSENNNNPDDLKSTIDFSLFSEFLAETEECFESINSNLVKLNEGADSKEVLNNVYRSMHNVKGAASLVGVRPIAEIAHELETALEPAKNTSFEITQEITELLINVGQNLDLTLEMLKNEQFDLIPVDECKLVAARLNQYFSVEAKQAGQATPTPQPESTPEPEPVAQQPEPTPEPAPAPAPEPVAQQPEPAPAPEPVAQQPEPTPAPPPAPTQAAPGPAKTFQAEIKKEEIETPQNEGVTRTESAGQQNYIRVSVNLLDKLMTLMGEMVLVRNQVLQFAQSLDSYEFTNLSKRLDVVTSELQEEMMKTRMQPIGNVLNKHQRIVRDLSNQLNKKIKLNLHGVDTELDRTLLEAVKDPLTHIIRNSCDHGLESPAERAANGKDETGQINVNSFHEGGHVIIEVQDDGSGIDPEKVLKKGIEKGVLTEREAAKLTEKEAQNLIFHPGFSTAEQISNVSGRGVGMDVVKTNIEKIGGGIELSSEVGVGTKLRMNVPLTLAIVPALIVNCGEDCYAIPQVKLVELVRVGEGSDKNHIEMLQGRPVLSLRGQLVSLIDLRQTLSADSTAKLNDDEIEEDESAIKTTINPDENEPLNIIVLKNGTLTFGVIVDDIQDTADIVVKPLNQVLKELPFYSGATVLGDGRVALILDIAGLAEHEKLILNHKPEEKKHGISRSNEPDAKRDFLDVLVFDAGTASKFGLPRSYVHRLEEFPASSIEFSGDQKVVRYRDGILQLYDIDGYLLGDNKPEEADYSDNPDQPIPVIVMKLEDRPVGLIVNKIIDIRRFPSTISEDLLDNEKYICRIAAEDGVITVIDIDSYFESIYGVSEKNPLSISHEEEEERRPHLLYAEDTVFFQRQVGHHLKKSGFDVDIANNGKMGLKKIKEAKKPYDMILTDIEMPHMNGFEMAQEIRKIPEYENIPIIALSSNITKEYLNRAQDLQIDEYLEKYDATTLLFHLNRFLKK